MNLPDNLTWQFGGQEADAEECVSKVIISSGRMGK